MHGQQTLNLKKHNKTFRKQSVSI